MYEKRYIWFSLSKSLNLWSEQRYNCPHKQKWTSLLVSKLEVQISHSSLLDCKASIIFKLLIILSLVYASVNVSSLTSVYSLENSLGQIAIYTRPAWECGFQLLSFLGDSNGGDDFEWILNGRAGRVKVNIYL